MKLIDVENVFFNVNEDSDWCALHVGGAIPEGTRAEWLRLLDAIESDMLFSSDNSRLAIDRKADGSIRLWSPRNSWGENSGAHVAAGDVAAFVKRLRREIEAAPPVNARPVDTWEPAEVAAAPAGQPRGQESDGDCG